ncbi:Short chain isoprenyl diphosphate synthase [uncultured archaeon]|nr:Short chain isoprenyl diphosphate synthase [uncultured archaeon]
MEQLEKKLEALNAPISSRLDALFSQKTSPPEVYGLLSEFMELSGKRLRPAFCLLSCEAVGGRAQDALRAATAIEMFHNFTLIHDDIEDASQLRRGKPCLHVKYGLPLALNAGDGLFMMVWREALGLEGPHRETAQQRMLDAFTQVLEGQAIELGWYQKNNWDVDEEQYYAVVKGKTGALIAASCEVGAILGGADGKTQRALSEFGMGLGVGFQIIDDALNIIGDEEKYKKEIGGDIREGKRTLMTIWAMRSLPKTKAAKLTSIMRKKNKSGGDVADAIALLKESGAVEKAMARAQEIVERSIKQLDALPESQAKITLGELAEYITSRER